MKRYFCVLAALALAGCGGSSGGTVSLTPSSPSASLNSSFGSLMNGTRLSMNGSLAPLTYDNRVGLAAQQHANDMYTRDYDSVFILGGGGDDVGDRVTAQGYNWVDIKAMIDKGEATLQEQSDAFALVECDAVGTKCYERDNFVDFGIARAGSGADTRWVLVLVEPNI